MRRLGLLTTCCGCFNLETGVKIIGVANIILNMAAFSIMATQETVKWAHAAVALLTIFGACLLLFGVIRKNLAACNLYLGFQSLLVIAEIMIIFGELLLVNAGKEQEQGFTLGALIAAALVHIILEGYWWMVAESYVSSIDEEGVHHGNVSN